MKWIVKVTEANGQHRITLPKQFCKENEIENKEILVIDDWDKDNIKIWRLKNDGGNKRQKNNARNG